jgi:hypothetical protein
MGRSGALVAGVVLVGTMAACGNGGAPTAAEALPDVVDVNCSPTGTEVSGDRFAARADGLHVRIVNTSGEGEGTLFFGYGPGRRAGGGEAFDRDGTTVVIVPPPGDLELRCAYDLGAREDAPVEIDVVDRAGDWGDDGLEEAGCRPPDGLVIDWAYRAGTGTRPEEALEKLAFQFDEPVTWRHVREGWADADRQTWVYLRGDEPWATALVTREKDGTFGALLEALCSEELARSGGFLE